MELILSGVKEYYDIYKNRFCEGEIDAARSNVKLENIHGTLANKLHTMLTSSSSKSIETFSIGEHVGKHKNKASYKFDDGITEELNISGNYYNKKVDIGAGFVNKEPKITPTGKVSKNSQFVINPIVGINVKVIVANYEQNANNYFEGLLGETVNIRRGGGIIAQVVIISSVLPYYKKNKEMKSLDRFNPSMLDRYITLYKQNASSTIERPNAMFVLIVDIDNWFPSIENKGNVSKTDPLSFGLASQDLEVYNKMSDIDIFFNDISLYTNEIICNKLEINYAQ